MTDTVVPFGEIRTIQLGGSNTVFDEFMIFGRALTTAEVRALYLDPVADLSAFAVLPQWWTFALFAVLLVVALAVTAAMTRMVLAARAVR